LETRGKRKVMSDREGYRYEEVTCATHVTSREKRDTTTMVLSP
jgi:hypothetical protein